MSCLWQEDCFLVSKTIESQHQESYEDPQEKKEKKIMKTASWMFDKELWGKLDKNQQGMVKDTLISLSALSNNERLFWISKKPKIHWHPCWRKKNKGNFWCS